MPEIKISELTSASTPAGTEVLAIVQSGDTKKTTINSLASALEDNLSTGAPTWTTGGVLRANRDIIAGYVDSGANSDAGGTIGLTLNDGYGNANLTFNHTGGTPDRSGSSARISSSVDSNQELLDFQLKSSVTSGTPTALTSVLKLYEDSIQLLKPTTLSTSGTGTTSLVNKGYIDTALSGKADTSHTHSQYSLNTHLHDDRYSQIGHGHSISNISNLQTILNGKIGETEINTAQFVFSNNMLQLRTIQEGQIATGAITNTKIENGAITNDKIATGAITNTKIENGAITNDKIATDAITETKIEDGAVTPAKLSTGAPNWGADGTLTTGHIFTNGERIEINYWGSGDRNAYIDFHSSGASAGGDYDARLFRYPGANGKFELSNIGTGPITVDREIADITDDKSIVTKEYVESLINSSALTGLLSIPLSSNYPSYYLQGTVISGSITGVWSGTLGKGIESITISLRNLSSGSNTVNSFYARQEGLGSRGDFSVTRTFTRSAYTIPSSGLYQLTSTSGFTTTSGATATPPA